MRRIACVIGLAAAVAAMPAGAQDSSAPATPQPAAVPGAATAEAVVAPAEAVAAPADAVAAQPAVAAAPAPSCELHVFPTLEGQAMTSGWLAGFGIIGALADASANKNRNIGDAAYLKEALGPKMQMEALKSIDIVQTLGLEPSQVIFEAPVADRKVSTEATARLSESKAPCYVELLITQNLYRKAAMYGRSLNNRYILKDFRTGKTSAVLVKGRGGNGLKLFPPKTEEEAPAAEQELKEVFVKNFIEFSKTNQPTKTASR